jgi:hypothetical protein
MRCAAKCNRLYDLDRYQSVVQQYVSMLTRANFNGVNIGLICYYRCVYTDVALLCVGS